MVRKIIFLLILTLLSSCNQQKIAAKRDIAKGIQFMKSGQYLQARIQFKKALKEDASNVDAHYYFGLLSIKEENFDKAIEMLTKAHNMNPADEKIAIELANLFIEKKQNNTAVKLLLNFAEQTHNPRIPFYLGKAYFNKKEFTDSVKWMQKSLALDPGYRDAYAFLGDALLSLNDIEKAKSLLSKAAKENNDPVILSKLGFVLFQIGNDIYLKEKKILDKITVLEEKIDTLKERKRKNWRKRIKKIREQIFELEEKAAPRTLEKNGILSEAKGYFKKALKGSREVKDAHYNLAMTHYLLGEYQESHKNLKRFIQVNPTGAMATTARDYMEKLEELIRRQEQKKLDEQK